MDSINFYTFSKRCWKLRDSQALITKSLGPRPLTPNPAIMPYWIVVYGLLNEIRFLFRFLYQKLRILQPTQREVLVQDLFFIIWIFWHCPLFTLYPGEPSKQDNQNIEVNTTRKKKCQDTNFLQVRLSVVSGPCPGVLILDCLIISRREDTTRSSAVCSHTNISWLRLS